MQWQQEVLSVREHGSAEVGHTEEQNEVCFGSITDVKAQLRMEPPRDSGAATFRAFRICAYGGFYALESSGDKFAVLNKKMSREMHALLEGRQLRFQAHVSSNDWTRAVRSWTKDRASAIITMEVNIYGALDLANDVGKILSPSRMFLQQPLFGLEGFAYHNPHFLHIQDWLDGTVSQTPRLCIEDTHDAQEKTDQEEQRADGDSDVEIHSILNSLSQHHLLHSDSSRADSVGQRVKTKLMEHQLEAVDFIIRRETGNLPAELSLWREQDQDTNQPFSRHIITGARRAEPEDVKGGILADEMGLGKSLVILSTIAESLPRAESFATEFKKDKDGPGKALASKATLIVVPSTLLIDSWVDEIRKHTYPGALTFHKHHGQGRQHDEQKLLERTIVFTTYATVATELCRGRSMLGRVHWFRIVLDEGKTHDVRNRNTKQFQAVTGLDAQHRWCLTGTPIQNSIEDLGALVAFLKMPVLENAATFRKFIVNPPQTGSRLRFKNLRVLLGSVCLRRPAELLGLPAPVPQTRVLEFTQQERAEYGAMQRECRVAIDMAVCGRLKKLNSAVLESLLKLRLYCNNGSNPSASPADADEILSYLQQNNEAFCVYCFNPIYSIGSAEDDGDGGVLIATCSHLVCRGCWLQHCHSETPGCPRCALRDGAADDDDESPPGLQMAHSAPQQSNSAGFGGPFHAKPQFPSKLLAFLKDVQMHPQQKSIAFSSWKKTLVLMGHLLSSRGIPFNCVHGSLSLTERLRILKEFKSPTGANILLMTLGTGGVGLNLAVATRIYLMEPQWNPSTELQAVGRSCRLDQTNQVTVVRYIMKDSVEDSNVLSRQQTKLELAGGGFGEKRMKRGVPQEKMNALLVCLLLMNLVQVFFFFFY
ncbi:SNF2 family N-terminal domain-containing protein [Diplogelasinospora grovesii]|uniref:SNF2 family N-terminal domain-containing protein n=1 Tax=Diplogelasinospora grovesii TaxID=303347 RepID=A0AAN6N170_9PEZI|nr:SNF2 family N-terminal domain-containing protein [Diplogelasinospora grovesii]